MRTPLILHIFPTFGLGGQQRRFAELVKGFSMPFRHHVLSLSPDIEAETLMDDRVQVSISTLLLKKSSFTNLNNLKLFRAAYRELEPDLICTYNWGAIEAVMALGFGLDSQKTIAHVHFEDGFGPDETPIKQNRARVFARKVLLRKSMTIVPSKTLYHLATKGWRLPLGRVQHIPNGIDSDRFDVLERVYDHARPVMIGTVGAFRPEKNMLRLIRLYDEHSADNDTRLMLIGDGPEMEFLAEKAKSAKRHEQINLPGATSEPEKLYKEFDIFALTSDTEQMPISLIEAMMAGLPVVATNVGDVMTMVSEENKPFIVAVDDEVSLLQSLEKLIANPDLRELVGKANQQKARSYFDRNTMITEFEKLFVEAIERSADAKMHQA